MQISRILFKKTLLARSCLRQAKQMPRACSLSMNTQMRYFSSESKTDTAAKSDRFTKKEEEPVKEEATEETEKTTEEPTEEGAEENTEEEEKVDPKITKLQEQISELESLLEKKETKLTDTDEKLKDVINKYRYQVAENDNTVKRYKDEVSKAKSYAITKFAKDLINVRDDFQRAIDHSGKFDHESCSDLEEWKTNYSNLLDGVKMTSNVFDKTMKRFDVEEYNPMGDKFDPQLHEAMAMVDVPDKEPNTI